MVAVEGSDLDAIPCQAPIRLKNHRVTNASRNAPSRVQGEHSRASHLGWAAVEGGSLSSSLKPHLGASEPADQCRSPNRV